MKKNMMATIVATLLAFALGAQAATYYWDDGTVAVDGVSAGGTGAWTVGVSGWEDGAVAQNWADGNSAVFAGTAGTVTLGGNISAGTLTFNTAGYTLAKGGYNLTIASLAGTGALTVKGTGTFSITGSSSGYSGGITLGPASDAHTTDFVTVGANDSLGTGTIYWRGATLQASTAGLTIANAIDLGGAGGLRVGGSNNFTLSGAVTMSGGARSFGNYGTATVTLGAIANGGSQASFEQGNFNVTGAITGAGALVFGNTATGTFTLSGASTYSGSTTISNSSTLKITGGGGIYRGGYSTSTLTVNSGSVLELENWQYSTAVGSLGGLTASAGYFIVNGGTIRMTNGATATSYGRSVTVNASGATLEANGTAAWTIDTVTDSNAWVFNSNPTVTLTGTGVGVFQKVINSGSGNVIKSGTGTWTLSGANTFSGTLTANGGTLIVSNTLRSASSVTANAGSTIQINATNMFVAGHGVAVANTMVLTAAGTGILQFNSIETRIGNVTLTNGGTLTSNRGVSSYDILLANTTTGAATVTVSGSYASAALMNGSGGIHLQGVQNFDVADITGNSNTDLTVSMILANPGTSGGSAGGINKTGAGTMTLSNAGNTFNGDITINNGTLIGTGVSGNTNTALGVASGSRTITVNSGGTLGLVGNNVFGGSTQTLANTPKVIVNSGGTMTINTYNVVGNIDLNGGTLTATGSSSGSYQTYEFNGSTITVGGTSASTISSTAASNGGMHIAGGKTLTLNVGDATTGTDLTISAALINGSSDRSGNGALLKTGAGTVALSGANTYSAGTTISAGTIVASNASALGSAGTVTLNDASTGSSNTSLLLDSLTIGRAITIANQGSGVATLGANGAVASPTFSGAITLAKDVTLAGSTNTDRLTFTGGIGGTGNVTVTGNRVAFDSTANTYAGTTTINSGGVLQLGIGFSTAISFLPDTYGVSVAGTLKLAKAGNTEAVGGLSGAGTVEAVFGSDTLSVGGGDATAEFSGVLRNNGSTLSLTKTGAGTQTLSGTNTYTGATTVNAGTLSITGSLAAGSTVTVASGATLGGTGTVGNVGVTGTMTGTLTGGAVTVNNGGSLTPGVAGSGTLTLGSLTLGAAGGDTSTINMGISGGATTALLQVNGNVTANGGAGNATFAFGTSLSSLNTGTYHLISYTGTQLGDVSAFAWSGTKGARQAVSIVNGTGNVDLSVTSAWPIWVGATSDWSAGSGNWKLNTDSTDTYFISNDTVHFDSTALSGTVDLTADVDPLTMTFEGDTLAYTLGSTGGKITSGSLIKTGASALTINNANTFGGGTTLNGGTLTLGDGGALGTGSIALNGGTLDINGKTIVNNVVLGGGALVGNGGTISGVVSEAGGARSLTLGSSLTLTGVNTYTGATTINAGTLEIGGAGQLGGGSYVPNISNAGTLKINSTADQTLSGIISGAGDLVKASTGTLTLTGVNTYGGATAINGGTLEIGGAGQLGSGSYAQNISNAGTLKINSTANQTLSGIISGATGALVKANTGSLTLTGVNTYGGATTINGGTLEIGGAGQLGGGSYTQNISNAGTLKVNSTANQIFSGDINGTGGKLVKDNTGVLTISGNNGYTGGTTLNNGTLNIGSAAALGTGAITIAGGTLDNTSGGALTLLNNNAQNWNGDFTFTGTNNLNLGTGAVTLGSARQVTVSANTLTVGGVISGAYALTKAGAGTMLLAYTTESGLTGNVTISGGTLEIGASTRLYHSSNYNASNVVTVNTGGTLKLVSWTYGGAGGLGAISAYSSQRILNGGTFELTGNTQSSGCDFRVASGSTGTFRYTPAGQTLTLTDNVNDSIRLGGMLTFETIGDIIVNEGVIDNTNAGGITKTGSGTLTLGGANTYTGTTTINAGVLKLTNQLALQSSTLNYSSAGTLVFDSSVAGNAFTFGGLSGSNNLVLHNNAGSPAAIALTVAGNTTTYSGILSGAGSSLIKSTGGTLTLTNTNTYTGGTTISGGTLKIGVTDAIPSGYGITMTGGALIGSGSGTQTITPTSISVSGTSVRIGTDASLVIAGTGGISSTATALYMCGTHTYSGTTSIAGTGYLEVSQGPLSIVNSVLDVTSTNAKALDIWAGKLTVRGLTGTGIIVANGSNGNAFTGTALEIATPGSESYTFSGSLQDKSWSSGVMAIEKTGDGTQVFSGANTFTGGTTIKAGTLAWGANNVLADTGAINVNGGTLDIGGYSDTVGAITLTRGSITGTTGVLTGASYAVESGSVSAILGGSGTLTKTTDGIVTLSGANTYTGATTVSGGTLRVNGSIASSATSVGAGGTLMGTGTVGGLSLGGIGETMAAVAPGNSIGSLKVQGDMAFDVSSLYEYQMDTSKLDGTDCGDLLVAEGNLVIVEGAQLTLEDLKNPTQISVGTEIKLNLIAYKLEWTYIKEFGLGLFTYGGGVRDNGEWFDITLNGGSYQAMIKYDTPYSDRGLNNPGGDDLTGYKFVTMSIVAIPEPGTLGVLGVCFAISFLKRKRV